MECDYYADENGTFILRVKARDSGTTKLIRINDLQPGEEIDREIIAGRDR